MTDLNDLIQRLRHEAMHTGYKPSKPWDLLVEAADEIERLRALSAPAAPEPAPAAQAEPVAELRADEKGGGYVYWLSLDAFAPGTKLYATPAAPSVPAGTTTDDMNALIGHAAILYGQGQTDMPTYFFDLAARIAPDKAHADRVREVFAKLQADRAAAPHPAGGAEC